MSSQDWFIKYCKFHSHCFTVLHRVVCFTNGRQNPPPEKKHYDSLYWDNSRYYGGLEPNSQYLWGMPALELVNPISKRCSELLFLSSEFQWYWLLWVPFGKVFWSKPFGFLQVRATEEAIFHLILLLQNRMQTWVLQWPSLNSSIKYKRDKIALPFLFKRRML